MAASEFSDRILSTVGGRRYRPRNLRQMADELGVPPEQLDEFRRALDELHESGRIVMGQGRTILPPEPAGKIVGTYRANPRGFGFITPESPDAHGDFFVPPGRQMNALTGDTVMARISKRGKRDGKTAYEARITKILERGNNQFVGQIQRMANRWLVMPEGQTLHVPIYVPDAPSKNARAGTQVVVEIVQYPDHETEAQGVIVEVLGRLGDPGVDTLSMIRQHRLPHEFPEECLADARKATRSFKPHGSFEDRLDLRDRTIVTIDPDDARDFDDAISLQRRHGEWELGVHIADVAHFVRVGSPLDDEARKRANSVYFPGHVIPMLPEVLSNGVCSLQEGVPRLTKSVFIRYNDDGERLGERFANSVISSAKRLTYGQATLILEGKLGGFAPQIVELVRDMDTLARVIQKRRPREGMISLDLPAAELVLNEDGNVVDVRPEDRSFSHTIIEMFMVESNEAVAGLLAGLDIPHLERIHPPPDAGSDSNVCGFLKVLGLEPPDLRNPHQVQELLAGVKGKPESFSVNLAILRSMQQAEYAPQQVGHFALGSEHYAHFTSPIRRYADLTIHRLLDEHLKGELPRRKPGRRERDDRSLVELGNHCSFTERRAEAAERELRMVKILRFLSDSVGQSFRGVITGVTEFGLFVQLDKYLVEGLVRVQHLDDDSWTVLPEQGCMIGRRSGRRLTIGDVVKVIIAAIHLPVRQLDLQIEEQLTHRTAGDKPHRHKPSRSGRGRGHSTRSGGKPRTSEAQPPPSGDKPQPSKPRPSGRGPSSGGSSSSGRRDKRGGKPTDRKRKRRR